MKKFVLLIGWGFLATSVFAQQVRLDIKNSQGGTETRLFALGSQQEWNTTSEKKFNPTEGDCSKFDVSKLKSSVREGRIVDLYGISIDQGSAIIHFRYHGYQLVEIAPFKINSVCTINQPTSQEAYFDGAMVLQKGSPQSASGVTDRNSEQITFTLLD